MNPVKGHVQRRIKGKATILLTPTDTMTLRRKPKLRAEGGGGAGGGAASLGPRTQALGRQRPGQTGEDSARLPSPGANL